jgi:Rrf2 family protein
MKLSSQEEIGLRCLVQLARQPDGASTIQEVARAEGLTPAYVAKILGILRRSGLVTATRGRDGGYALVRPAEDINLSEALIALGGRLYDIAFCDEHSANAAEGGRCTHEGNCSLRPVLVNLDRLVHDALGRLSLKSLVRSEPAMHAWLKVRLPSESPS